MANVTGYVSKKLTANIAEQNVVLGISVFKLIKNASVNTVTINVDNATGDADFIELAAGESIENFKVYCKTLYYKASADGSILKVIGMRDEE